MTVANNTMSYLPQLLAQKTSHALISKELRRSCSAITAGAEGTVFWKRAHSTMSGIRSTRVRRRH